MEPTSEGEPPDTITANLRAVDKAIGFTKQRIQSAAMTQPSAEEAAQIAIEYIFYGHQWRSLMAREAESDPSRSRNSSGEARRLYNDGVKDVSRTGKLLDSLNKEVDLPGIRGYLLDHVAAMKMKALPYSSDGQEVEFEKTPHPEADPLEKIARSIPDSGVSVKTPELFAWMDPRFNGEGDTQTE